MYAETMQKFDRFLSTYSSEYTRRSYSWMLGRVLQWCTSQALQIDQLTPAAFNDFLNAQGWNANSRYLAYCATRAFMRWVFGDDHALAGFRMRRPKPRPQRTLNAAQAADLLQGINTGTPYGRRHLAMVTLMLNSGLRSFEVAGALLRDLDLEGRRLQVHCKGDRWRTAHFSAYTAACLGSWLGVRAAWAAVIKPAPAALFISKQGRPLDTRNIRHIFERLAKRTGLAALSPHDLRRTFATLATRAGASPRVVMAAGGWSDMSSLLRYTQAVSPDDLEPFDPVDFIMRQE